MMINQMKMGPRYLMKRKIRPSANLLFTRKYPSSQVKKPLFVSTSRYFSSETTDETQSHETTSDTSSIQKLPFREHHILAILKKLDQEWRPDPWNLKVLPPWKPLDAIVSNYYLNHRALVI